MKLFYDLTPSEEDCAVALGNFDGLHLGHQRVLSLALQGAENGLAPAVLTFDTAPAGGRIFPQKRKVEILERFGFRKLYLLHFESLRDMTAQAFVREVLAGVCRAKKACCGFNFTFGRGGKAGSAELARLCAPLRIEAAVAPPVLAGGAPVSSTRIRGLIAAGRVDEAARLLPCPFGYETPVLPGRHLGRRLGAPTLNQPLPEELVRPKFGVYVSAVYFDGAAHCGVTNVGVRPTVGAPAALAETWMPDYAGADLYGRTVRVDLLRFLRPERRFAGLPELRAAILRNGRQAREYFSKNPPPPPFP